MISSTTERGLYVGKREGSKREKARRRDWVKERKKKIEEERERRYFGSKRPKKEDY